MGPVIRVLIAALVAVTPVCAQPDPPSTEIYIVRHAEKVRIGDASIDNNCAPGPRLTRAGFARALALRDLLSDAKLDGVFSTNCRRTIQTGILVAADHGPDGDRPASNREVYAPLRIYETPEALAEQLDQLSGRYLVIGHGNTMDVLIEALGASFQGGPVVTGENDRLYTVSRTGEGQYSASGPCSFGEPFKRPAARKLPMCEPIR